MWMLNYHFTHQLEPEVKQTLTTAADVFRSSLEIRERSLLSRYRNIANEPRVQTIAGFPDVGTVRGFLNDLLEELECSWGSLVNEKGEAKATATRQARLGARELEAAGAVATQRALEGQPTVVTVALGGTLFDVVSVPVVVRQSNQLVGALTIGDEVGLTAIQELKTLTHCEVVLFAKGQVAATTLREQDARPEDYARFVDLLRLARPALSPVTPVSRGKVESLTLANGAHFVAVGMPLVSASIEGASGYVLLSSLEPALEQLRATQRVLLTVSLLGIVVSTLIIWLLVRKVTRPLRELRDGAEAVGRGDFSRRVAVASDDECGELAAEFNQMTENLRTSRQKLEQTVESLKTTQAQLVQSEKLSAIGQFTAGVAHELNNPLTVVLGFAELMTMSDVDTTHREYLNSILGAAERCKRIVQNLLSFARQHQPERKPEDLNQLVHTTIKFLHYQLHTSNIKVIQELAPDLPAVMADAHQLQQVFINLITNARQALEGCRPDGLLRITTEAVGEKVRVRFADNGPGIPAELLLKVFDPFFTTKEVGKGTGLGLSLCYGIVNEHGGTIRVQSPPGTGAVFTIELPAARETETAGPSAETAAEKAPDALAGQGKRVLAIDDEAAVLCLVRDTLSALGHQVDTAADGETALSYLAKQTYDATLCDWKMPGLSGQQIYERVSATDPAAARRFVFMTGDVVNEKARRFFEDQRLTCLAKPFTVKELHGAVKRLLPPS
jgi:signal transduction histidine kinase